jgi:hypothetical protein
MMKIRCSLPWSAAKPENDFGKGGFGSGRQNARKSSGYVAPPLSPFDPPWTGMEDDGEARRFKPEDNRRRGAISALPD